MTNKEFILELIRLLKPKYYNKLTWLIVTSGILLIAPSLITIILHYFIKSITEYNLIGDNDKYWGILLIVIGLIFNMISQIKNGTSSFKFNFVINKNGNVTINQNTFIVTDTEKANEIIKTLSKSNQNITLNYQQSSFTKDFIELFKSLPWIKGISLEPIENNIEVFKIDFESSDRTIKQFYVNVYSSDSLELFLPTNPKMDYKTLPIISLIYWGEISYWTLNTYDIFKNNSLSFEEAIKNDISNIIGDLTYIVSDLEIKLSYNKKIKDNKGISHPDYGTLIKVELLQKENNIELDFLELGIIDTMIDMKVDKVTEKGDMSIVIEKIAYQHIFKLSTILIRFLSKSNLSYEFNNTLRIRKEIVETMKKINATISYAIPVSKTDQIKTLFKKAFGNTWVYKRYESNE